MKQGDISQTVRDRPQTQPQRRPLITPFRAYLGTQAMWFFSFGLQTVIVPHIALNVLEVGSARLGMAQAALTLPSLLLLLFGGVIAERIERRRLLTGLHVLAVLPPLFLMAAFVGGYFSFSALVIYGAALGAVGAIMMPTRDAALNAVAEANGNLTIQRAVVVTSLIQFLGQIAGMTTAALAAFIGAAENIAPLISLQAIAMAMGAVAALALPSLAASGKQRSVAGELGDGLAIVWNHALIRSMALSMVGVGVFVIGGGFLVLLPYMVDHKFDGGLAKLGIVYVVFWSGAAAATAALSRIGHVTRPGKALAFTFLIGGLSLIVFTFPSPFWLVLIVISVWGASSGVGIAMSRSIVQEAAPPEALARVLSVYQLGFMGGAPIGAYSMGLIVEHSSLEIGATVLLGACCLLSAWIGLASPVGKVGKAIDTSHAYEIEDDIL
jgi:MFS family permease